MTLARLEVRLDALASNRPRLLIGLGLLSVMLLAVPTAAVVQALMSDSATLANNTISTATLSAPSGLTASGLEVISLSWGQSADVYASGYRVFRSSTSGGPYTQIAEVTPQTTVSYMDAPGLGTFYYVVRAFYENWESVNSNQASTGP